MQLLIPLILILAPVGIVYSMLAAFKYIEKSKRKRSPFTGNFLRGPGESLNEKIMDISEELLIYVTGAFLLPLLFYALFVSDLYFRSQPVRPSTFLIYLVAGLSLMAFFLYKSFLYLKQRRAFRLGYEGEVAVGQELNQMMRLGYYVFHDFIADRFNIDHIVVGPAGVFAVETKARAKPTSDDRTADAQVIYDGKSIRFPDRTETKPIEQARMQAAWLEKWLASATGERIPVRPLVALPGWYVKRTAKEGIPVINPKQFHGLMKYYAGQGLTEGQIKRVAHQIDQRCRNVAPRAVKP